MAENEVHVFYSSKPRVVHIAINIAIAPILLYLAGLWAWPPTLPHYIVFAITTLFALRYARQRWQAPRLVLDDKGLFLGKFYPMDTVYRAEPVMRAIRLTVLEGGQVRQKVVGLGWASRDDFPKIVELLRHRFQREVPK